MLNVHKLNVTASLAGILAHLYRAVGRRDPLSCDRTLSLNEHVTRIPQEQKQHAEQQFGLEAAEDVIWWIVESEE